MKKGKTSTGFTYSIDESVFDDMELLEMLSEVDKGDTSMLPGIIVRLFGEDGKKKLYDHCREDGRVPITRIGQELAEIFGGSDESKKS